MHFLRQSTDVVMRLYDLRRVPLDRYALDHIRVQRALRQKAERVIVNRRSIISFCKIDDCIFEDADELVADDFAFLLRISDAAQFRQKSLRRVDILELDVKIFAENALHDFLLARTQQTVVHENARELIANGLVEQRSRY